MKVTYNWLQDFVEIKVPANVLADKLMLTEKKMYHPGQAVM